MKTTLGWAPSCGRSYSLIKIGSYMCWDMCNVPACVSSVNTCVSIEISKSMSKITVHNKTNALYRLSIHPVRGRRKRWEGRIAPVVPKFRRGQKPTLARHDTCKRDPIIVWASMFDELQKWGTSCKEMFIILIFLKNCRTRKTQKLSNQVITVQNTAELE